MYLRAWALGDIVDDVRAVNCGMAKGEKGVF
jgi:hypothetical protein